MRRVLPILVLGFSVVSLLICLFGDSGVVAYARMDSYRRKLAANVEKLQARNLALQQELAALQKSPERNLVMARDLGLYRPGDEVVRLEGLSSPVRTYEVGDLLRLKRDGSARNAVFKATGIGVSAALAVFALIMGRASRRKAHDSPGR